MNNLSPAARATYDAFNRVGLFNEPSFETDRKALAAAIRVAADCLGDATSAHTLYAISDELGEVEPFNEEENDRRFRECMKWINNLQPGDITKLMGEEFMEEFRRVSQ